MTKLNLLGLLENHALFRNISPIDLGELQKEVVKIELEKGFMLFRKGDIAEATYIVVYGLLKLSIPSSQGNDKVLELIRAGQSFGEAMMFLDEPYPFYAEALENTLLLKIPRAALLQLLDRSPLLSRQMMAGLSYRLLGFIRNVERYSLQNATQRVIDYLLQTSAIQCTNEVRLELKKHLLASLLNLSPETLSRVLHQLMDEDLIRVSGSIIHIGSAEALKTYQHGGMPLH
ncbi:Crp/Fnr family transcriptional regulator [Undibacterium oligocarboniphilum]|uniref:Crp/Fnr family transcriptional regulator n=1 Tax=Undibacterium oligocarboniphilum TaxID=666702 RepID=A0A850QCB4_9BURK|nr:Crp/Fnr family transcriptional regulator [Undibacterium oligocarboniphilum]MBC3868919.1 Crp/Fnr family transcriptional regulator [Undibacterium oligocarboniphilum]NVO76899.1 Crp/Fnr family transcriptional regulator [Undibacterium oligocarboniphilum]